MTIDNNLSVKVNTVVPQTLSAQNVSPKFTLPAESKDEFVKGSGNSNNPANPVIVAISPNNKTEENKAYKALKLVSTLGSIAFTACLMLAIFPGAASKLKNKILPYSEKKYNEFFNDVVNDNAIKSLNELAGLEKPKELIKEKVISLMENPQRAQMSGSTPTNLILLWGPSGTGKTFLAQSAAKDMKGVFGEVNLSRLNSKFIGEGEKQADDMFNFLIDSARKHPDKKHVVLMDEIDTYLLAVQGNNGGNANEMRNVFLRKLEQAQNEPNLIIIGTTNKNPYVKGEIAMDEAAMSRFKSIIEVKNPTADALSDAFKIHFETANKNGITQLFKDDSKRNAIAEFLEKSGASFRDFRTFSEDVLASYTRAGMNRGMQIQPEDVIEALRKNERFATQYGKKYNGESSNGRVIGFNVNGRASTNFEKAIQELQKKLES